MGALCSKDEGVVVSRRKKVEEPVIPKTEARELPKRPTENVEDYYDLGDELGRGAFSVVKKATNKETKATVAVKLIDKQFTDKADLVMLRREIDNMTRLEHPNILHLIEVFETDQSITLVMELVTGGELFYKIAERGHFSEKDAASIVRQTLKGIQYLHAQGICHRDLKPENLLCTDTDKEEEKPFRVIIADFGLSKAFDGEESLETSAGTPDYVAPEVITAEHSYDKSVDIWSLGVVTYVLLCGYSPFKSTTQRGLFDKIIKCEYEFPEVEWNVISKNAKDFIRHMIVKEPKKRMTATELLDHPWLKEEITTSESLANGKFSENLNQYNENRKNSFKR